MKAKRLLAVLLSIVMTLSVLPAAAFAADRSAAAEEPMRVFHLDCGRKYFTAEQIKNVLHQLDSGSYGMILRAKGIVACADGGWIHFDYVPGEMNVRSGSADIIGKICVIGSSMNETEIARLFGLEE